MNHVNCTSRRPHDGACLHQAAPRRLLGAAICILNAPAADPRIPAGCALCTPYQKPPGRPEPPPSQIRRENAAVRNKPRSNHG